MESYSKSCWSGADSNYYCNYNYTPGILHRNLRELHVPRGLPTAEPGALIASPGFQFVYLAWNPFRGLG